MPCCVSGRSGTGLVASTRHRRSRGRRNERTSRRYLARAETGLPANSSNGSPCITATAGWRSRTSCFAPARAAFPLYSTASRSSFSYSSPRPSAPHTRCCNCHRTQHTRTHRHRRLTTHHTPAARLHTAPTPPTRYQQHRCRRAHPPPQRNHPHISNPPIIATARLSTRPTTEPHMTKPSARRAAPSRRNTSSIGENSTAAATATIAYLQPA